MNTISISNDLNLLQSLLYWCARILNFIFFAIITAFAVGEGIPSLRQLSRSERILMVCFLFSYAGLLVNWIKPCMLGSVFTVGGLLMFYIAHYYLSGKWPRGWIFVLMAFPGVLTIIHIIYATFSNLTR